MLQFCQKVVIMDKEQFLINQLNSQYIGDDGAVVGDMIYSNDAFFEGVHFRREWMSMQQIARKAMLVNISDAIAMFAQPLYALVTISLPPYLSKSDIVTLTQTLQVTAQEYGCEIIGGDTVGGDRLNLSITIISKSHNPLLRKGLHEGDLLLYTGTLGESKRDLDRLFAGQSIRSDSRFYEPLLRQEFISKAREHLRVGMDISDGLYCDTNKLLDYNGLGFEPIIDIDEQIGLSGEEYEMLIGIAPDQLTSIEEIASKLELPLTLFAKVTANDRRYPCRSHHF